MKVKRGLAVARLNLADTTKLSLSMFVVCAL